MNVVGLREAKDFRRRTGRNNTRLRSRSISRTIGSRTTDSASHWKISDASGNIAEAEQGRRDRRGITGSDDSDNIAVNEKSTQSNQEGTEASTEGALKGYSQLQTKYEDLPHPKLFERIFGFGLMELDDPPSLWSFSSQNRKDAFVWLREKDIAFSREKQCGFRFDTVTLAGLGDLHNVQSQTEEIEAFARDSRKGGDFSSSGNITQVTRTRYIMVLMSFGAQIVWKRRFRCFQQSACTSAKFF